MKRSSCILIPILIFFVCGAGTCTEENNWKEAREERLIAATKDSIRLAFETDYLKDDQIMAYEETAKQKLSDFADYLKIVSDTSLGIVFRRQAAQMAEKIFIHGNIYLREWNKAYPGNPPDSLNELIRYSLSYGISLWIKPEQIKVMTPLTLRNDSTYAGVLSFIQQCLPVYNREPGLAVAGRRVIEIIALKRIKTFGKEQLSIWTLYLGDIK
jgi:hypothetical protein